MLDKAMAIRNLSNFLMAFTILFAVICAVLILIETCQASVVDTTKAVIHHTASPEWTTVDDIDRWHKERGWDGVGYHYVIYTDGTVKKGRSLNKRGAHAKGRNDYIGIALVGYDNFSENQIRSLRKLIEQLGITHIERHHDKCPGKGLKL